MPTIKSSTSLRNEYSKISKYCHETGEPVYVTVNGEGDFTVMRCAYAGLRRCHERTEGVGT